MDAIASPMPITSAAAQPVGCPLTAALNVIGGKWNLICLYWLQSGPQRFSGLQRLMPQISHKVLTETLRRLEQQGLVRRTHFSEFPPRVEYCLSSHGDSLRALIESVHRWGRAHLERRESMTAQILQGRVASTTESADAERNLSSRMVSENS